MLKKLLILIFLLPTIVSAQSYKYSIFTKGKNVGTIESTIDTVGDVVKVNVLALANVHFLIGEHVKYKLNSNYKKGELYFSSVTFYLNGKSIYKSVVRKVNNNYIISEDDHESLFDESINYSGSLLYFVEPKNYKQIFSEIDNINKTITKQGKSKYKVTNPQNGKTSYFTYKNGILSSAKINHTYVTLELRRLSN